MDDVSGIDVQLQERDSLPDPQEVTGSTHGMHQRNVQEVSNLTLHQCARKGDVESAKILIRNMGDHVKEKINDLDEYHLTPLHYAVQQNDPEIVQLFINYNADINAVDEEGHTPLHYASRIKERVEQDPNSLDRNAHNNRLSRVISDLISQERITVNFQNNDRQTPLHYAVLRGNYATASQLLGCNGIDTDVKDKQGLTPLHMAAAHSHPNIVMMLINNGASLLCKDEAKITPLHVACAGGNIDIVKMLFEAGTDIEEMVNDQDEDGNTCLSFAVENGHHDVVKLCIEKGVNVNLSNQLSMYPLHLAAVCGDVKIVRLLIEKNAFIDASNRDQATPLHIACQYNHVKVVKCLVERGADIERRDKENQTPLLVASVYGHVDTVLHLIQKRAYTSAMDKYDKTAIYLAAEQNHVSCLEALLKDKKTLAMINVSDSYDNDPLHIAAKKGYLLVVKLLLKNGAASINRKNEEEQTPCHLAAKYGRTNIVRELVGENKNAVNDEDKGLNTALHLAALWGHAKVAGVLIEIGANVAARNGRKWTPLDCAAAKGWTKTVRVLLKAGSSINHLDKEKTAPLHLAAMCGHTEVVELLIDWKADVKQRDSDGNNCLDLAIENNNREVALSIIKSKYWKKALRNCTGEHDTPMRKLIRKMPDAAEAVFNRCIDSNKKDINSEDYEITFNYEFLDDVYSILKWREKQNSDSEYSSFLSMGVQCLIERFYNRTDNSRDCVRPYTTDSWTFKKNHPLMIMVTSKREGLLVHPLVTALLTHKWCSFGRLFYYINFFLYAVYLMFITGYIVSTTPPYVEDARISALNYSTYCEKLDAVGFDQPLFAKIGKYVIILLVIWNLLREIFQIYQAKFNYLSWENLIEWIVYITSLLFVIDIDGCQTNTGYRYPWQWNVGTVAIFLAWIDLVLFAQKVPKFGIYVVMFNDVLKTFIQFFLVFMLFIIAFALAFFALFQNQDPFSTVWLSLIKATVMMIGEFEYDSIYIEGVVNYNLLSYLMFCLFMVIMSIIIMNLLVGLAVDNIKEVQEQAVLTRKAMQVELVLDIERIVPDHFRKKHVTPKETVSFNKRVFKIQRFFGVESDIFTPATIDKALNPELDEMKNLKNTISKISYNQNEMKGQINNLESMLKAMYENSKGVEWKEEDDTYYSALHMTLLKPGEKNKEM